MFLTFSIRSICLQIACTMLVTVMPLACFACLLFVFSSFRFPFMCRAGSLGPKKLKRLPFLIDFRRGRCTKLANVGLRLAPLWDSSWDLCCTPLVLLGPLLGLKLAPCWRPWCVLGRSWATSAGNSGRIWSDVR